LRLERVEAAPGHSSLLRGPGTSQDMLVGSRSFVIMGNTMPPRDPDDDEDEQDPSSA
jgi:hypothetical protein